jgi:hypothetical protein
MNARCICAGMIAMLVASGPISAEEGSFRYVEKHGSRSIAVACTVTRAADSVTVATTSEAVADEIRWERGKGTVAWTTKDAGGRTNLSARRSGDTITVRGTLDGRQVQRELRVGGAPWYQIFGPAIIDLLPPGTAAQEFWVVNPDDLAVHKMLVRRAGTERIEVNGLTSLAERIHFSPAGALAPFWGADFWYRVSDGAWIYSKLPEDGGITVTAIAP